MAEIKANDIDLINAGDTIISLVDEYISVINAFFDSYNNLNKVAWNGNSADIYVGKLLFDRQKFLSFGEHLKMYGKVIKNTGVNIERIVSKWEDRLPDV